MEKTLLIDGLKSRVGEDDAKIISDKTFEGIADSVLSLFEDDSKITEDTWKLPVATLKQFAGQKRFDEKAFTEKFKEDYAKEFATKHNNDVEERIKKAKEDAIEQYKKEHPGDRKKEGDEDFDAKVNKAIEEKIGALMGADSEFGKLSKGFSDFLKSQTEKDKVNKVNGVRAELRKHLIEMKANEEACIDDALGDIDYGEDPTFDTLKQSAIDAYEKRYKRYYGNGGKPFGGSSSGSKDDTDDIIKNHTERAEALAKDAKNYADSIEFAK